MRQKGACTVAGWLIGALLASSPVWSQTGPEPGPRVGLALSGGGALGTAHVGVLKVLEELNIPVHFVAGTSMGAIVGGMYAAGVSPAEMEQILSEIDWRSLLDDRPNRRETLYRQKVDDQTFLTRFEVGFNHGSFQLPPGLVSGQQLDFALQSMALRTAGIDNFDNLPIPFRAVATDVETGEMVVLGQGDLGRATRASMSIPGIFSPIEIDGRLLVDGGFVRNLPVDVVRDMGADVVIAVSVGKPPHERADLDSLAKISGQVVGMQIWRNVQGQAELADVLVDPDLDDFKSSQFERALEMVEHGEVAARSAAAALSAYSVSDERYAAYLERLRREVLPPTKVSSVQIAMPSTADAQLVVSRVGIRPDDSFDLETIRRDLRSLYETGDYEKVDFFLSEDVDGYGLHIEAHEKSWGPNYLRFGVNLFADLEGESSFDLLASYTRTKVNRLRGQLKVSAQLGENPAIFGEYYQPLSLGQTWFTAIGLSQSTSTEYLPVGGGASVPYGIDLFELGVDLGFQAGRYAELRLGLSGGSVATSAKVGPDSGEATEFPRETETDFGSIRFTAVVDQFDNMNFPHHGYFVLIDYRDFRETLGSDSDYKHLVTFVGAAVTRGRHTLLGLSNLYSALSTDSPETYDLGGLFRLSGAPQGSIAGQYGGNLSLLYLYRVLDLPIGMGDGLYVGASIEAGNLWNEKDQTSFGDLRRAGSIFIGMDTILGPVYLAQGFFEGGEDAFYLYIGRTF